MTQQRTQPGQQRTRGIVRAVALVCLVLGALPGLTACTTAAEERKEREEKADFHYGLANGYFQSKNIDLAIREVISALEIDPEHADAHYLYGFILCGRKQFEDAVDHFRRAIATKPNFFAARNHLGVAYLEMERWADAVSVLEPLLKEPTYTTQYHVYNNLGWAYLKMNDLRLAEKNLKLAVFLNPKYCQGYRNLGLLAMQQRDYRGAVDEFTEATARCPTYAELHMQRGEALAADGQLAEADAAFRKCAELGGETPLGRRCRARTRQAHADGAQRAGTALLADGGH